MSSATSTAVSITKGGEATVLVADDVMYTKNIRFKVRKGTHMPFHAQGCTFESDQVAISVVVGVVPSGVSCFYIVLGPL